MEQRSDVEKAFNDPHILELLRRLNEYGLGVTLLHMHDAQQELIPLPDQLVQLEREQRISFVSTDSSELSGAIPVAWRWKDGKVVVSGLCCSRRGPARPVRPPEPDEPPSPFDKT